MSAFDPLRTFCSLPSSVSRSGLGGRNVTRNQPKGGI